MKKDQKTRGLVVSFFVGIFFAFYPRIVKNKIYMHISRMGHFSTTCSVKPANETTKRPHVLPFSTSTRQPSPENRSTWGVNWPISAV